RADDDPEPVAADTQGPGLRIGVSSTVEGLAAVGGARELADTALRLCPETGGTVRLTDHLPAALVASSPELGAALADRLLGPLAGLEPADADVLLETLATWLACDGSAQRASRLLYCHRNTVLNRLRRYAQPTGRSLARPSDLVEVTLALTAHRLLPRWRRGAERSGRPERRRGARRRPDTGGGSAAGRAGREHRAPGPPPGIRRCGCGRRGRRPGPPQLAPGRGASGSHPQRSRPAAPPGTPSPPSCPTAPAPANARRAGARAAPGDGPSPGPRNGSAPGLPAAIRSHVEGAPVSDPAWPPPRPQQGLGSLPATADGGPAGSRPARRAWALAQPPTSPVGTPQRARAEGCTARPRPCCREHPFPRKPLPSPVRPRGAVMPEAPPDDRPALHVESVDVTYGRALSALRSVSLTVPHGAVV